MHNTTHPYHDANYIFNLLRSHNLLTQEQILQLTPRTVVAQRGDRTWYNG